MFPPDDSDVVMVQAVSLLSPSWLPPRIAAFEAEHPNIRVALSSGNSLADFRRALPGRGPDLQIFFGDAAQVAPGSPPFLREQLAIVARPDIVATLGPACTLAGHRLIDVAQHDSGWSQMLAALPEARTEGAVLTYVGSTPVAFALAVHGLGLVIERVPASDDLRTAFGLERVPGSPVLTGTEAYHIHLTATFAPQRSMLRLRDWLLAEARRSET